LFLLQGILLDRFSEAYQVLVFKKKMAVWKQDFPVYHRLFSLVLDKWEWNWRRLKKRRVL